MAVALLSVLRGGAALSDTEIAKFTNSGCATPSGTVSVTKSSDGASLTITSNGVPDHVWGSVSGRGPVLSSLWQFLVVCWSL